MLLVPVRRPRGAEQPSPARGPRPRGQRHRVHHRHRALLRGGRGRRRVQGDGRQGKDRPVTMGLLDIFTIVMTSFLTRGIVQNNFT